MKRNVCPKDKYNQHIRTKRGKVERLGKNYLLASLKITLIKRHHFQQPSKQMLTF